MRSLWFQREPPWLLGEPSHLQGCASAENPHQDPDPASETFQFGANSDPALQFDADPDFGLPNRCGPASATQTVQLVSAKLFF